MNDADATAIGQDEDYYIPVELVTITGQIGPHAIRAISRRAIPTGRISQPEPEAAYLQDDLE